MLKTQEIHGISEVHPKDLHGQTEGVRLVDVRRPDEFSGELGHIKGAELVTLGPDLETFLKNAKKNETIVFICKSGGRSGHATMIAKDMGFSDVHNMSGGMMLWNELGYETDK